MKKIVILSLFFIFFLGFTSCTQDGIEAYQDTDNIYFSPSVFAISINGAKVLTDSTGFSFGLDNPAITEKVFLLPIRVQGTVSNVDRKVKVTVDPSSTAVLGTHFSLPENIVMHAGKEVDTIAVTVHRTEDMKTKGLTMVLNLEENEFFTTKMQTKITNVLTQKTMSFVRFKISFDDKLTQPKGWYAPYLGVFTAKKFYLMCELMNLQPEIFNQALGSPGLSIAEFQYYQNFMKRYLADQKASGNTIYEIDGTEMIVP
ncbi:DUF4843 domain-containing protein [Flavobacterium sp. FlaQc-48]|uniref:DUF4843 domain-containing protein n=1 Tax=Flavobacterium sp. FlaQc-48 TaxID=3374181 RepID=UPI00375716AD